MPVLPATLLRQLGRADLSNCGCVTVFWKHKSMYWLLNGNIIFSSLAQMAILKIDFQLLVHCKQLYLYLNMSIRIVSAVMPLKWQRRLEVVLCRAWGHRGTITPQFSGIGPRVEIWIIHTLWVGVLQYEYKLTSSVSLSINAKYEQYLSLNEREFLPDSFFSNICCDKEQFGYSHTRCSVCSSVFLSQLISVTSILLY